MRASWAGLVVVLLVLSPAASRAAVPQECPGDPIEVDRTITGEFDAEMEGRFVMVPFRVPRGTTAVRVKYCHDQPESPTSARVRHTLDIGLYEPRSGDRIWGARQFRGWGGSSHPDVIVSRQGFTSHSKYLKDPRAQVPGRTTRGFLPGRIQSGRWAAELGLAAIVPRELGDADEKVAWRIELELSDARRFADERYRPAAYRSKPVRRRPGWYAGDFHVHAEHSSLGAAPMREVFDYAFGRLGADAAGLDFITLSDYVTTSSWGEVGRFQEDYPGKLIVRSAEVVTYRGHANNHASVEFVDYRTGPIFKRTGNGRLVKLRSARPASDILDAIHSGGGFTQINHPTIFPSQVPSFAVLCRGCPWDYSAAETDYSKVDAIEIATGPPGLQDPIEIGPNPFIPTAIEFWEDALGAGHKIAAVGSSDSHHAGRREDPVTQAPVGTPTTVVRAKRLSERGVQCAVRGGHTYVKIFGNKGPDLRLAATAPGDDPRRAIMGDTLASDRANFRVRVIGGSPGMQLVVIKDNAVLRVLPVTGPDFSVSFPSAGPGRYRLQLQRLSSIEAVSSPIYLEPGARPTRGGCRPRVR